MKSMKIILVGALAAMTLLANAQGFGGGRGMGMMRGGMASPTMLLMREDVREELKISSEQSSKLESMQQDLQSEMMASFAASGGERPSREAMTKMMADVMKKVDTKIKAILTPEQSKRLRELYIQMSKNQAMMQPDVAKELGISDEVLAKAKALNEQVQRGNGSMWSKIQTGEMTMEDIREKSKKNNEALNVELGKMLTEAQKKKLAELGGKPFEFKEQN